jgi:hypothetical protein
MARLIEAGDPTFTIELEYGEKKLTWRAEGVMYAFSTKISDVSNLLLYILLLTH